MRAEYTGDHSTQNSDLEEEHNPSAEHRGRERAGDQHLRVGRDISEENPGGCAPNYTAVLPANTLQTPCSGGSPQTLAS